MPEVTPVSTSIADALAFLEGVGVPVEYGLHDAYYRADLDKVFMPERAAFDHDLDLVSTLAHEVCNIASVLISRIIAAATRCFAVATRHIGGRLDLQPRLAGFAASGRES